VTVAPSFLASFCRVGEFFGVPVLEHNFRFMRFAFDLLVVFSAGAFAGVGGVARFQRVGVARFALFCCLFGDVGARAAADECQRERDYTSY
jgi:hypothetical protein